MEKVQVHRPGPFKQSNKGHKHGRHRSKGSISIARKGKVTVKTISKRNKFELNREQRRHQHLQLRQKKRDEVLAKKRSLGGLNNSPLLISVLPLNKNIDISTVICILSQCDEEAIINKSSTGITYICLPRMKQRFAFVEPSRFNDFAILDSLKVADSVLLLISAATGTESDDSLIDKWGINVLASGLAQGLPTPTVVLSDLESIGPKKRNDFKQDVQKLVNKFLPDEKIMALDKNSDALNLLRKIGNQKRKPVFYRDRRPNLLADKVDFVSEEKEGTGTLKVSGYLRGTILSANQLVHIPGLGDFQMSKIDACSDPNKLNVNKRDSNDVKDENYIKVIQISDISKQESLDSENVPDPMDAEQTWPTGADFEMAEADRKLKKVKKVPKGWSEYQAAWIPDDDFEFQQDEDSGSSSEEDEEEFMDAVSDVESEQSHLENENIEEATAESELDKSEDKYDQETDMYKEKEDFEMIKAAKSDIFFPDEVDTPMDTPARVRFQKYRGLESFRSSPWDPKENLPSDYSRIFQFENFDRTRKRIMKEQGNKEGALPGWYIIVHIKNVPSSSWSAFQQSGAPVVVIGLLQHEHKMSVLNAVLKRTANYGFPIRSKEKLIFQCGFRRFTANPVFSEHTNGQKHKFQRFFQPDATSVATFFAPIQFPPAPILCYKEVNGTLILVATGRLLSCNPDRLIIKRAVLSGHPLKIHKNSAVIRFMFFNREDILYFKPCKLRTKMGRSGHIKEALGTHGHMKCAFDGQLKSQDTVLLNLYKRVFPKWTFEDLSVNYQNSALMET